MNKKFSTLILVLISILTACSSQVRGEAPQVAINLLRLDGNQLAVELRIRNINDVPLNITAMPYRIEFADQVSINGGNSASLTIGPRGTEISQERITISETLSQLFAQLDNGEKPNLGYHLDGELQTDSNHRLQFEFRSRLFTVPGREREYR